MHTVAVFVGSLRKDSINKKLADNLAVLGADALSFRRIRLDDVPMYNQDMEAKLPEPVARMKGEVALADSVLFVTPEYNRAVPAVLKNALDWCSRPSGQSVWKGKPAALCGISGGAVGTAVAQSQLRNSMLMLGMAVYSEYELYLTEKSGFFDEAGTIADEGSRKFLQGFLHGFARWIQRIHS